MTRIALVGYGVRGRQWAQAIESIAAARLAVIVDTARPAAAVPVYTALSAALDAVPVDAVIIATPPEYHAAEAILAMERGLPVLCEKPLTEDIGEAVRILEAARRTGTPMLVGMNFRYVHATGEYRRLVRDGDLGEPIFGQFIYIRDRDGRRTDLNDFPLTMTQPMLFEQSIHHLDLLRYVYGREVVAVEAMTWNPSTSVYRDASCVALLLRFEGNLHVVYLGTWTGGSHRLEFRWRTDFADGLVVQDDQFGGLVRARRDPRVGLTGPLWDLSPEPLEDLRIPRTSPFVDETRELLGHFLRVADGLEQPGPTVEDHMWTVALLHACVQASAEGRRVVVAEFAAARGIPLHFSRI